MPFSEPTPVTTATLPRSLPVRGAVARWDWILARRVTVRLKCSCGDADCLSTGCFPGAMVGKGKMKLVSSVSRARRCVRLAILTAIA